MPGADSVNLAICLFSLSTIYSNGGKFLTRLNRGKCPAKDKGVYREVESEVSSKHLIWRIEMLMRLIFKE